MILLTPTPAAAAIAGGTNLDVAPMPAIAVTVLASELILDALLQAAVLRVHGVVLTVGASAADVCGRASLADPPGVLP